MSNVRASFCIVEDASSQAGLPLHKVLEGDAIAGKNALAALVAKDQNANFRYLLTDSAGKLLVNTEGDDVAELYADGEHAGSTSGYQTIASIALATSKDYKNLHAWASCFRDSVFQIVHDDNGTPTTLVTGVRVGSGAFTFAGIMKQLKFTSGATGTQSLILKAKNETVASSMSGVIGVDEVVPVV